MAGAAALATQPCYWLPAWPLPRQSGRDSREAHRRPVPASNPVMCNYLNPSRLWTARALVYVQILLALLVHQGVGHAFTRQGHPNPQPTGRRPASLDQSYCDSPVGSVNTSVTTTYSSQSGSIRYSSRSSQVSSRTYRLAATQSSNSSREGAANCHWMMV